MPRDLNNDLILHASAGNFKGRTLLLRYKSVCSAWRLPIDYSEQPTNVLSEHSDNNIAPGSTSKSRTDLNTISAALMFIKKTYTSRIACYVMTIFLKDSVHAACCKSLASEIESSLSTLD